MKRVGIFIVLLLIANLFLVSCNTNNDAAEPVELILATTTSTFDSGLLADLLPQFEEKHNMTVKVVSLGTGQALELGKNGDADILLVHAKTTELEMVAEGHFVDRHDVMYNDFVIVGPTTDPAMVKGSASVDNALAAIAQQESSFISRGDDSGTHKKEVALWQAASIAPAESWYVSAGAGMGDTLRMADEKESYTLTDRATYLAQREQYDLEILYEGDANLFNQYGVMAVNPDNYPDIQYEAAKVLIDFFISSEGQEAIAGFKPYGDTLFFPNAD
ncbi:MAG: substrate-binding domain-containing protein [Firmicutes bacterium]|nr:substrate-binding domain-containing protein [Bacillota bacterium]